MGFIDKDLPSWCRESDYVLTRDGVRLAIDIYRPMHEGAILEKPMPVIWALDRYRRAYMEGGKVITLLDRHPWIAEIITHEYIVAVVDIRGGGASFGKRDGSFSEAEMNDTYDVTEWLAAKPWCSGKIGMFGRSYLGIVQYLAARDHPPHLVTVVPEKAMFDLYAFIYPGGVFRQDYKNWVRQVREKDEDVGRETVSIRETDHIEALKEHMTARYDDAIFDKMRFRDSKDPLTGEKINITRSPSSHLDRIKESSVAFYHIAGWFDMWPKDAILWFKNLKGPQKIMIGPWAHKQEDDALLLHEHICWYDYWLKGIDNGVMSEPPIKYFLMDTPEGGEWRTAEAWPIPHAKHIPFYLFDGQSRSGTIGSVNDGMLLFSAPTMASRPVVYHVDFNTTSGNSNRWTNGYKDPFSYPDMAANDAKGLTYTSDILTEDIEVIGHPYVDISLKIGAPDIDIIVYLEEVLSTGYSSYVTEGLLRASHRKLSDAPYEHLALPFHRSFADDVMDCVDDVTTLQFDLHPTAKVFRKGNRIRITIVCADQVNLQCLEPLGATLELVCDAPHLSMIYLPIAPSKGDED